MSELQKAAAKANVNDEFVKQAFLQAVQPEIAAILVINETATLAQLAKMADEATFFSNKNQQINLAKYNEQSSSNTTFPTNNNNNYDDQPSSSSYPINYTNYGNQQSSNNEIFPINNYTRNNESFQENYPVNNAYYYNNNQYNNRSRPQNSRWNDYNQENINYINPTNNQQGNRPTIPYSVMPYFPNQKPKICKAHLYHADQASYCKIWCKWPNRRRNLPMEPNSRPSSPARSPIPGPRPRNQAMDTQNPGPRQRNQDGRNQAMDTQSPGPRTRNYIMDSGN